MAEFTTIPDENLDYDEDRCPHDGGTCHHACETESECFRESGGMALTTPHEGYPLPGHELPTPALCLDRLRFFNAWLNDDGDVPELFQYENRHEIRRIARALFEGYTGDLCVTCGTGPGEECRCPDPFPPGNIPG